MLHKLLLFLSVAIVSATIVSNLGIYLKQYDADYWYDAYQHSRYFQGDKADYIFSDAEVYAVRAYRFTIELADPETILPGHPPFAMYLMGISTLIFGNPFVFSPIAAISVLVLTYLIARQLDINKYIAAFLVLFVATEPLFREQIATTLLDIYYLAFSLLSFFLYQRWRKTKKNTFIIASQLVLGLAFATKFWPTSAPLASAMFMATILTGDFKKFTQHTLSLISIPVGFVLGHITYFIYHQNLFDFVRYQRYIISWWAGSPQTPAGQIWDLIFFNRWHTWWGSFEVTSVSAWQLTWPIVVAGALLSLPIAVVRKKNTSTFLPLYLWVVFSLMMFSFSATYPRHLLVIFPASYILLGYSTIDLWKRRSKNKARKSVA